MIFAFTDCPFGSIDRTARPGDGSITACVGCCTCCLDQQTAEIDSRRLSCGQRSRNIADYRIICVVRGTDGDLQGIGYAANGNAVMYDEIWTVEQAREAIEQGHRLYTLSPTGGYGELELSEDAIRGRSDHSPRDTLDDLPRCG